MLLPRHQCSLRSCSIVSRCFLYCAANNEISLLDAYIDRQWRQWENSCQQLHHWFRCCNHPVTALRPIAADPQKIRDRGHRTRESNCNMFHVFSTLEGGTDFDVKGSVFLMMFISPIPYRTLLQAAEATRSTVDLWLDASMDGFQALLNF